MASSYPGSLDSFTNPSSTDAMDASAALYHDVQHANINDAVEAVQAELGTDPAGNAATVKARLEYAEAALGSGGGVWPSGGYVANVIHGTQGADLSTGANRLYYFPWWCPFAVTVDRVAVNVSSGVASANARLGIYSCATGNVPGSLLLDGGEVDCATAAVKTLTVSQALTAGTLYWLAVLNESASVQYSSTADGSRVVGYTSSGGALTPTGMVYESRTYTDGFPATAAAWSSLTPSLSGLWFWLRRT